MPGALTNQTWLSLRDTAREIGRELLGDEWHDAILDRDRRADSTLGEVYKDLRKVLDSTEVTVHLQDYEQRVSLDPKDLYHFATKIDLKSNTIELGRWPGEAFDCFVNAKELSDFLQRHRHTRTGTLSSDERYRQCREWLRDLMVNHPSDTKHPTKTELRAKARQRFQIGKGPFHDAWTEAIGQSGVDWDKPGRPKTSHKSSRGTK